MRTLLKVVGVLVLVGVASIVFLAVTGVYIAKRVHVVETGRKDHKDVDIDTPFGHFGVHASDSLNPEMVGIPIYPGAERTHDGGGADFTIDAGDLHKDMAVAAAAYLTDDSPEKVREFYQKKLPSWPVKFENDESKLEMKDGGHIRTIGIKTENGRTRIGVASIGPPAAN